ncbi:MAG: helix-turn-helix domain-containing protein [Chthoniobacteraceae bacterium]|nr:helix-turn-helix domain-containing protein [Chthoniobacteraceae bacterium]
MRKTAKPLFKPAQIVAGMQQIRWNNRVWRPLGTTDWLFVLTLNGPAWYRLGRQTFMAEEGDLMVIRQGTPHDYGCEGSAPMWDNLWIHVHPRASWLEWLQWPELAPGLLYLHLPRGLFEQVESDFRELEAMQHSQAPLREELAMNILERAILRCQSLTTRDGEFLKRDPRIAKAADWLGRNLRDAPQVGELAKRSGLSRSRFSELFHGDTGQTVTEFVEQQRLARACHLLRYTSMSATEIADQLGYSSLFYFSSRFKRAFGWSPRAYRQGRT